MIECRGGVTYTGISNDLAGRWKAHRGGRGARFTRSFPPVRMLTAWCVEDRGKAARMEAAIKSLAAGEKRKLAAGESEISGFEGARRIPGGDLPT